MNRYVRQQQLPEIGAEGQTRLCDATVAVIGCGALGSVVAMYLAGAGVGRLIIADFDTIDLTNLQRQLFYTEAEAGRYKAQTLRNRLLALNSTVSVETIEQFVRRADLQSLAGRADIIIDASDNPDTKYMISDISHTAGKPCVIGGVSGWQGQVMTQTPDSPTYRDIFPESGGSGFTPCSIAGVVGPAAGTVASLQAAEAIKLLTGAGKTLAGRFMIIDTLNMSIQTITI